MLFCPGCHHLVRFHLQTCPKCGERTPGSSQSPSISKLFTRFRWMDALIGIILYGLFYRIVSFLNWDSLLAPFRFWIIIALCILAGPPFLAFVYRYRALAFGLLFGFVGAVLHIAWIILCVIASMS